MKKATCYFLAFTLISAGLLACTEKPKNPARVEVKNQGVHIDYTDSGKGDTTLLFVHGWGINKTYWSDQVNHFSKKYRVVTMDMGGYGKSGKNRNTWNTAAFAGDVTAVIKQLKLNKVILIGHSMAGDIVLQAAIDEPKQVIGIVGIDNFKSVGTKWPASKKDVDEYQKAINMLRNNFKATAIKYFNEDLFYKTTSQAIRKRILDDVRKNDSVIATKSIEWDRDFNETNKLKQSKRKLYLINSDVSPTDTTGLVKNGIPYLVRYVHATGHYPMVEKPADFNRLLQEIINDIAIKS